MPRTFIKEGDSFVCECGREFSKSQSLFAHQSHCKIHLGDRYDPEKHQDRNIGDKRAWSRGKTKEDPIYGDSLKRIGQATKSRLLVSNPLSEWNKHKPADSYKRQSATRKRKYATGELVPAPGVGRGKYSYLTYGDRKIMLRSTYEFIYALYLLYNGLDFEYESVRASYNDRTYVSDFLVGNKIIEIKGNYHADTTKQQLAFQSLGYQYEVKFWKDIYPCYEYLRSKIDIDSILESIRLGHDSKNYYNHIHLLE